MKLSFQDDRPAEENQFMFAISSMTINQSALQEGIIEDFDLAMVPEVMPVLFKFIGTFRDDIYRHTNESGTSMTMPLLQKCFCYAFAKGAECASLWHQSPSGFFEFNYSLDDAIAGRCGVAVPEPLSETISNGIYAFENVYCDFQDKVLMDKSSGMERGGRWVADIIACGLYSSAAVGLDFGLNIIGFK